jgi:hypothetical protein
MYVSLCLITCAVIVVISTFFLSRLTPLIFVKNLLSLIDDDGTLLCIVKNPKGESDVNLIKISELVKPFEQLEMYPQIGTIVNKKLKSLSTFLYFQNNNVCVYTNYIICLGVQSSTSI